MVLPLYLAQTPGEMTRNPFSANLCYMACHFSLSGAGLSNLPVFLPTGTMLILDDATPWADHDPQIILRQLSQMVATWQCESILLDFERPGQEGQQELAKLLTSSLPCPVGVSSIYADSLSCPVFLPPAPPDKLLSKHLGPWQGRDIWLETALTGMTLTLTESGCTAEQLEAIPEYGLQDKRLYCHYAIQTAENTAVFQLWRTPEDLNALLTEAQRLGVTRAIGLWQELNMYRK